MRRILLSSALSLLLSSLFAQSDSGKEFARFASRQDSLFVAAYKKQDIGQYNALLKEFMAKYDKLPKDQQKRFLPELSNAYYNLSCTYSLKNNKSLALDNLDKSIK